MGTNSCIIFEDVSTQLSGDINNIIYVNMGAPYIYKTVENKYEKVLTSSNLCHVMLALILFPHTAIIINMENY